MTNVLSFPIPCFDLGANGPPLHFLHANGYPPACYKPFLDLLKPHYHVFGMLLRPLWKDSNPGEIKDWQLFSTDLLQFLASNSRAPVIGVGHSIGAIVTLRAALRDPGKFRALVLIDPVLFVPAFLVRWHFIRLLGLGDRLHPLIPAAKKRRRTFDDLEKVFHSYRKRKVFRYLSDENLRILIEGITHSGPDGTYELVYSPDWEAQIYRTGLHDTDIWQDLSRLEVPTLILRGAETDTFLENAAELVKRKLPDARVEVVEKSTHMLPLERPGEVIGIMQSFINTVESGSLSHSQATLQEYKEHTPKGTRAP
jgi:pimeloyl-ACP methyl ester carboxylesterase